MGYTLRETTGYPLERSACSERSLKAFFARIKCHVEIIEACWISEGRIFGDKVMVMVHVRFLVEQPL